MEIIITAVIFVFAAYIIYKGYFAKNKKNYNCDCNSCSKSCSARKEDEK